MTERASTWVLGMDCCAKAAVTRTEERRSPKLTTLSDVRGVSSPTAEMPRRRSSRVSNSWWMLSWSEVRRSLSETSSAAVLRWRVRRESESLRASSRSFFPAKEAAARRVSVTLDIAETTTMGLRFLRRREVTMEAVRRMAVESSTEVPPNFMTTILLRGWLMRAPALLIFHLTRWVGTLGSRTCP